MKDDPGIGVLDHVAIRTAKMDETIRFYEVVLGLENGPRPNFSFPGAWIFSDGHPALHLFDASVENVPQAIGKGALHHVAFCSRGFDAMKHRLIRNGVWFDARESTVDGSKRIFVRDPNGVPIEFNYSGG
jgi:catechol 2,3-dioxygenase-like lactoylglutathione lyase family enzyme